MGSIPYGMGGGMPPGGYPQPYQGVPSYPGTPAINSDPLFRFGPRFDGMYSAGLTTNPMVNAQFMDVDTLQSQIYSANGLGYAPMGMPGMMPPYTNTPSNGNNGGNSGGNGGGH